MSSAKWCLFRLGLNELMLLAPINMFSINAMSLGAGNILTIKHQNHNWHTTNLYWSRLFIRYFVWNENTEWNVLLFM